MVGKQFQYAVSFTLTPDKIHGKRGEFTVKETSEVISKRGQFSLTIEGSTLTGSIREGQKYLPYALKHLKKVFENQNIKKIKKKNPNQTYLPFFQHCTFCARELSEI